MRHLSSIAMVTVGGEVGAGGEVVGGFTGACEPAPQQVALTSNIKQHRELQRSM